MFVHHLLAESTCHNAILKRAERVGFAGMYYNESMWLVELSRRDSSPSNLTSANVLAAHVRAMARLALRQQPTDDKINEAFKRATEV